MRQVMILCALISGLLWTTACAQDKNVNRSILRYNIDFGAWDTYTLSCADYGLEHSTKSSDISIDIGYTLRNTGKISLSIFSGLGLSNSTFKLSKSCDDYSFYTDADVDGDSYYRHYKGLTVTQDMWIKDFFIPLYVDLTLKTCSWMSVYAKLGAKMNININKKTDSSHGHATVYGVYPQYDDLILDSEWGHNGFGETDFYDSTTDDDIKTNKLKVMLLGGLGLKFCTKKYPHLVLETGVRYERQLGNTFKPQDTGKATDNTTSVVYNTIEGTQSKEHIRSLTNYLSKSSKNALLINIAVSYQY